MNTKIVKTDKQKSWALPGVKLTHDEFIAGILTAEEGPFYTINEIRSMRQQWSATKKG